MALFGENYTPELKDLITGLSTLHEDLTALRQTIGVAFPSASTPLVSSPSTPPLVSTSLALSLPLPIPPATMTEMLYALASQYPDLLKRGIFKLSVSVPAGSTVVVVQPTLPGTVNLFVAPLGVTADNYSTGIIADVKVDGYDITPVGVEYTIDSADQIQAALYTFIQTALTATIQNTTATSTIVTFSVEVVAVATDLFFNQFWMPIVIYGYNTLRQIGNAVRSGG